MATKVTIRDFARDGQGKTFADVLDDAVHCKALEAALEEMNKPEGLMRMLDAVDRYGEAPLAGCVREIEATPEFQVAARRPDTSAFWRLKLAVGVAVKLVMETQLYYPSNLPSGNAAMGRLKRFSKFFTTARKYHKGR